MKKKQKFVEKKFAFKIAYIGTNYYGYEKIKNNDVPTVEKYLFEALKMVNLIKDPKNMQLYDYAKSGRTDSKVSAAGNVFSLKLKISEKEQKFLCKRINTALPKDIKIIGCCEVPIDFDARRSTIQREYFYFFFSNDFDIEAMNKACSYLVGSHDFLNFCKYNKDYDKCGTVRKINECYIQKQESFVDDIQVSKLVIKGSGFLWHQVRLTIAALMVVGRGQIQPEVIKEMLNVKSKAKFKFIYTLEDPENLILNDCYYKGDLKFEPCSDEDQSFVRRFLTRKYQDLMERVSVLNCVKQGFEQFMSEKIKLEKVHKNKAFSLQKLKKN